MFFTKMHGCGNDYISIDCFNQKINLSQEQISFLCSLHFGIGSEGLLMLLPSDKADFRMRMFNVDGTEAEMCGNGIRCITKFAHDKGVMKKNTASVETKSGIKYVELIDGNVRVNMGQPEFLENPTKEYDLHCVSMGNPHAVMIVDDLKNFPVSEIGPKIENHKCFPNRTNVEFAKIIDKNNIELRVWERGCSETLACGTGACGTFAVLNKLNLIDNNANIKLKGGNLKIEIIDNQIFMTGNAIVVFNGEINI